MSLRPRALRLLSTALAALMLTAALVGCGSAPPPKYEWMPVDAQATGVDPDAARPVALVEIQTLVGEHFFSTVAASDSSGLTVMKKEDWSFPDPVPPSGVLEKVAYRFDELSLLRAADHKQVRSKSSTTSIILPIAVFVAIIGVAVVLGGIDY